jgi:hypothetical protein
MRKDERELASLLRSLPRTPAGWREAAKRIPRDLKRAGERAAEPRADRERSADPAEEPLKEP